MVDRLWLYPHPHLQAEPKVETEKCHLFKREVVYLGHVVCPAGIFTDPAKIKVIQNWPTPKDVSNVCSGLGMFGYYLKIHQRLQQEG